MAINHILIAINQSPARYNRTIKMTFLLQKKINVPIILALLKALTK
jgi:hypothetical protein